MIPFTFSPQVRYLSNKGKFHDARSEHSHQVFFLYVGPLDPNGDVMVRMPFYIGTFCRLVEGRS